MGELWAKYEQQELETRSNLSILTVNVLNIGREIKEEAIKSKVIVIIASEDVLHHLQQSKDAWYRDIRPYDQGMFLLCGQEEEDLQRVATCFQQLSVWPKYFCFSNKLQNEEFIKAVVIKTEELWFDFIPMGAKCEVNIHM